MPYRIRLLILAFACAAACSPRESDPQSTGARPMAADSEGWMVLFDGMDLSHWNAIGDANWELVDGTVRANAGNGFLVSDTSYTNFDLEVEFYVSPDANSGIFLRCMDPQEISDTSCYEANIYDRRPDPTYRTGAIVNVSPPGGHLSAGGRWNRYEISLDGPHLMVKLNDVLVVDVENDKLKSGPLGLQYGAGTVMFRRVRIRAR